MKSETSNVQLQRRNEGKEPYSIWWKGIVWTQFRLEAFAGKRLQSELLEDAISIFYHKCFSAYVHEIHSYSGSDLTCLPKNIKIALKMVLHTFGIWCRKEGQLTLPALASGKKKNKNKSVFTRIIVFVNFLENNSSVI